MQLVGKRIVLIPITKNEKDEFRDLVTKSYASKYWYGDKGDRRTREEFFKYWHEGFFDQDKSEKGQCYWIVEGGIRIGEINYNEIYEKDKKVEIDILIGDKENLGHRYGVDAIKTLAKYLFSKFDLNKIWVEVRAFNIFAIRAFEKVGFRQEGLLREEEFFNDKFIDCVRLGLLNREFTHPRGS